MRPLRYLWVHSNIDSSWMIEWHERQIKRRQERGFDIDLFVLRTDPGQREIHYFPLLDRLWRRGEPKLMRMYEALAEKLQGRDVLIHFNGANLHPEFLQQLDVLKIYHCADDPESTPLLSKPVAHSYDIHMISNIATLDMYRAWGLPNVYFWPLGSLISESDVEDLNVDNIRDLYVRTIPVVFFGALGGVYNRRTRRIMRLAKHFPEAYFAGSGWARGFVNWEDMWAMYRKAQIGWNVHNSSGPINFRTYDLAAHGVLQICDNKSHLGQIYKLGTEAIGFETVEECIDLTRYYLAHPEEQREIAARGWMRWRSDYTPDRIWDRLVDIANSHYEERKAFADASSVCIELREHERNTSTRRSIERIYASPHNSLLGVAKRGLRIIMPILRKLLYSIR